MGVITVFVKDACRFCDTVLAVLTAAVADLRADARARLRIQVVDVTHDYARAQMCKALAGEASVPQVFFNSRYVGNCTRTETFHRVGVLRAQLEELAAEDDADFPPPVDAKLVRLTSDVAFAALLTEPQVEALPRQGFRTVICIMHPEEPGYPAYERDVLERAGVAYETVPPVRVPHFPSGILVTPVTRWLALASPQMVALAGQKPVPDIETDMAGDAGLSSASSASPSSFSGDSDAQPAVLARAHIHAHSGISPVDSPTASSPSASPVSQDTPVEAGGRAWPCWSRGPRCLARDILARHEGAMRGAPGAPLHPRKSRDTGALHPLAALRSSMTVGRARCAGNASPPRIPWAIARTPRRDRRGSQPSVGLNRMTLCDTVPEVCDADDDTCTAPVVPPLTALNLARGRSDATIVSHNAPAAASAASVLSHGIAAPSDVMSSLPLHPRKLSASDRASTMSDDGSLIDEDGLHSFDARDDDLGGRDPLEDAFTPSWGEAVLEVLERCDKPVLVHDRTGIAACAMALVYAARRKKATLKQVHKWAGDLGFTIQEQHVDLSAVIQHLLVGFAPDITDRTIGASSQESSAAVHAAEAAV